MRFFEVVENEFAFFGSVDKDFNYIDCVVVNVLYYCYNDVIILLIVL